MQRGKKRVTGSLNYYTQVAVPRREVLTINAVISQKIGVFKFFGNVDIWIARNTIAVENEKNKG